MGKNKKIYCFNRLEDEKGLPEKQRRREGKAVNAGLKKDI